MTRRPAPAQVVIVERRQVIVNERVRVDHFEGAGRVLDAIQDPVIGLISDRFTRRGKRGRIVVGKDKRLQLSDPVKASDDREGSVRFQMPLKYSLVKVSITEGAENGSEAAHRPYELKRRRD